MVLPWRCADYDVESASKSPGSLAESNEQRTNSNSNSSSSGLPGSPCLTFLKSPIVVERKMGEKTGLLPIHRQARIERSLLGAL